MKTNAEGAGRAGVLGCVTRTGALALIVIAGASAAHADPCTGAKLKALGKAASGLASCQAKVAASNDASALEDCHAKAAGKLVAAFAKAGACAGALAECQGVAQRCESEIAEAFTDTFPSKCEAAKRKAAGRLVRAELGCYAKAAARNLALDAACVTRAQQRFASALAKAGTCPQPSSSAVVEARCVEPAVLVDAGGVVTDVCPATVCCDGPTTMAGPLVCTGGSSAAACTADGGTPLDGAACDENGCVAPPGDPNGCCELGSDCTMIDAAGCAALGGAYSSLAVCEQSGACASRSCDPGPLEIICGGGCPAGKACSAVMPAGEDLTCVCTSGTGPCGGLGCGDGCPTGTSCQGTELCFCAP